MTYKDKLSKIINLNGYISFSGSYNHEVFRFYINDPNMDKANNTNNISKIVEVGEDYVVISVSDFIDVTEYIIPLNRFIIVDSKQGQASVT